MCHILFPVFPVPPFQQFRLVVFRICEINGTAKNIQDAPIDVLAANGTQPLVHQFGIDAFKVGNMGVSQIYEVAGDAGTDTWNGLEFLSIDFIWHVSTLAS